MCSSGSGGRSPPLDRAQLIAAPYVSTLALHVSFSEIECIFQIKSVVLQSSTSLIDLKSITVAPFLSTLYKVEAL